MVSVYRRKKKEDEIRGLDRYVGERGKERKGEGEGVKGATCGRRPRDSSRQTTNPAGVYVDGKTDGGTVDKVVTKGSQEVDRGRREEEEECQKVCREDVLCST
jgi:hypothetical protein